MSDLTNVDAWDDLPDGTLAPFISEEERDQLITDRTVVALVSVTKETTIHGPKMFAEIVIPPEDTRRVCTFRVERPDTPRMKVLAKLAAWLKGHKGQTIPVVLVSSGPGYILADPRRIQ